jgi:RimJ/RimL family protein N-acetyltransferase
MLEGLRVIVRAWHRDEAALYVSLRDDEVFRWTTESPESTVEMAAAAIAGAETSTGGHAFAIVDKDTGRPVGNLPVSIADERATVAYWLAPEARGRGLLTEALALVLAWLPTIAVRTVELEVHPDNDLSIRVADRAGFALVGARRSDARYASTGEVHLYERQLERPPNVHA